jgi:hypothetical protein
MDTLALTISTGVHGTSHRRKRRQPGAHPLMDMVNTVSTGNHTTRSWTGPPSVLTDPMELF